MKQPIIKDYTLIIWIVIFIVCGLCSCAKPFYDGEGNRLPKQAVKTLVRSQYVITTPKEDSIIAKYFK